MVYLLITQKVSRTRPKFAPHWGKGSVWQPFVDVYETAGWVHMQIEIAGMDLKDFNITYDQNILNISGNRPEPGGKTRCHFLEIPYGHFDLKIQINGSLDPGNLQVDYQRGFLSLRWPKSGHTIEIKEG